MTSSPRSAARRFSATSSSTGTLSLKSRTCIPADSAFCVSRVAYAPGTDTIAAFASGSATAASSSEDGLCCASPAGMEAMAVVLAAAIADSPLASPLAASPSLPATTASTRSLADARARSGSTKPRSARISTLAGVPITAAAHSTPSASPIARVAVRSCTEST